MHYTSFVLMGFARCVKLGCYAFVVVARELGVGRMHLLLGRIPSDARALRRCRSGRWRAEHVCTRQTDSAAVNSAIALTSYKRLIEVYSHYSVHSFNQLQSHRHLDSGIIQPCDSAIPTDRASQPPTQASIIKTVLRISLPVSCPTGCTKAVWACPASHPSEDPPWENEEKDTGRYQAACSGTPSQPTTPSTANRVKCSMRYGRLVECPRRSQRGRPRGYRAPFPPYIAAPSGAFEAWLPSLILT